MDKQNGQWSQPPKLPSRKREETSPKSQRKPAGRPGWSALSRQGTHGGQGHAVQPPSPPPGCTCRAAHPHGRGHAGATTQTSRHRAAPGPGRGPHGRVPTRGSGVRPPDRDLPSAAPGTHQELQGLRGGACARHVGTSRCGKAKAVAPSDPARSPEAPGSGSHRHPRRPTSALHRAPRPPAPPSGLHGHRACLCSVFSRLLLGPRSLVVLHQVLITMK